MGIALLISLALAQSPESVTVVAPEKPKLICRESEQETGSHIRTGRRCKTAEEWEREDAQRQAPPPSMRITEGQGDALTKQRPQ